MKVALSVHSARDGIIANRYAILLEPSIGDQGGIGGQRCSLVGRRGNGSRTLVNVRAE